MVRPKAKHYATAYDRGFKEGLEGKGPDDNPFRIGSGNNFRKVWEDGRQAGIATKDATGGGEET